MTQARLVVEIPDGPWIGEVSKEYPDATFQVLSALPGNDEGFALVWISSNSIGPVLETLAAHETVTDVSLLQRTESAATIQIETSMPMILLAAKRSGIPVEMPVEIQDGVATVDVAGSHDRLSELGSQFSELGLTFDVEYVQERRHPDQVLTPRQQELVETACKQGYYDTPRECTLTELADEVDLAKSTCSETLHRAEEKIVKRFVQELSAGREHDAKLIA